MNLVPAIEHSVIDLILELAQPGIEHIVIYTRILFRAHPERHLQQQQEQPRDGKQGRAR